jgi:hypothetical protein
MDRDRTVPAERGGGVITVQGPGADNTVVTTQEVTEDVAAADGLEVVEVLASTALKAIERAYEEAMAHTASLSEGWGSSNEPPDFDDQQTAEGPLEHDATADAVVPAA